MRGNAKEHKYGEEIDDGRVPLLKTELPVQERMKEDDGVETELGIESEDKKQEIKNKKEKTGEGEEKSGDEGR
jgi:hypothetical protein